jgi:hypothetical protein
MKRLTLISLLLAASPALADTDAGVTLTITNDAGAVTMVHNMTQRECDAAVGLLSDRKRPPDSYVNSNTSGYIITNGIYSQTTPAPHTPDLIKVECVRSTTAKP